MLLVLCFLVRRLWVWVRFVRFPRPSWFPRGCGSACRACRSAGLPFGWRCVPVSSLPAVRRAWFVWAVRPAVVRRRSGVLLWVWVWVSPPCSHRTS